MNYLIDLERSISTGIVTYWKANRRGYTTRRTSAGLYSDVEAIEIVSNDFDKRTVAVSQETVKGILE